MASIQVLDNGMHIDQGDLQFLWFRLLDETGRSYYRCVALTELVSIPVAMREDYDLLAKQWAAVRGLYNANVDFVYSAAGIFSPEHIGIVQFYGSAAEGSNRDEAARQAIQRLAAVKATLANYPQSKLASPNLTWMEWYIDFITQRSQNVVALLGHPDPRQTRRGLGRDGEIPNDTGDDLAAEQNEILFRGLAMLREDFIFQVTAAHVGRRQLTNGLVRVAQLASNVASRRRGAINLGFSLSLPIVAALSASHNGGYAASDSQSRSVSDSQDEGWGQSHTDSYAHTESQSVTAGGSETHGIAITHTESEGVSSSAGQTQSQSVTHSQSVTESQSTTQSQSVTQSSSVSQGATATQGSSSSWSDAESSSWQSGTSTNASTSETASQGQSSGVTQSSGMTQGQSSGSAVSQNQSSNWAEGSNWNVNTSVNGSVNGTVGVPGVASAGANVGGSVGGGVGGSSTTGGSTGTGTSTTTGQNSSVSTGTAVSQGQNSGVSNSVSQGSGAFESSGGSSSQAAGGSSFGSTSQSNTTTQGTAVTQGAAITQGTAATQGTAVQQGSSQSVGFSKSSGSADSITESHSWSRSWAHTRGSADTWGQADSRSQNWGRSHMEGESLGTALSRSGMRGFTGGFSTGLIPGVSIGRSWQTEDDVADRLTEVIRQLEGLLNQASAEGGFMTDAVLFTASEAGEAAAGSLVPQAFHGPNVPTPVLTVRPEWTDADFIRQHALAFLHYPGVDAHDPLGGYLWTRYATLLTPGQLAAYTAPGLFEEGTTSTVMAPIPKEMGFYPVMSSGENDKAVVLGHQYSPETADLTTAPVRLAKDRLMHTMFAGDTGWGKSVAAVRMAYETTLSWQTRTVVLDFGAGWRQLLNAPGLQGHVDILQLWPDSARPLRWNPLQIGRHINPETQWRAFADIFGSIAKLGVKRQKQEMLEALRKVYLKAGVLVDDPEVRADPEWGAVLAAEATEAGAAAGTALGDLARPQRQRLAVLRSSKVGLSELYREIQNKLKSVPPRDTMLTGVLEGILFRMNALVQGSAAAQFAAGPDTVAMEDLARSFRSDESEQDWGITIIEGGMFLDDFGKAFLLGWAGWQLYTDMVARRVHEVAGDEPLLQIFFEEANKIFGGIDDGGSDESGGVSAAQRFGDMFRDARKYRARLHVITQAPSMIPPDIISSCNNLVAGFLKNPKDKDIVLSALARSEKGFHDEPWRRFLDDLPIGMAIGRFPYTQVREEQRPFLFRPYLLDVPEPSDAEIEHRLGGIAL